MPVIFPDLIPISQHTCLYHNSTGKGMQIRLRQFVMREDAEKQMCSSSKLVQKQSCTGRVGESCSSSSKSKLYSRSIDFSDKFF